VNQGPRDEVIIRTPDRRLRVFVSSTLGELAEERRAVSRAISVRRLTPVMFEAGARPYSPAKVYRAYLARHSLVYADSTGLGSRLRMLETVREFMAERLAARPDAVEVGRRHAGYYGALAEQADRPLRGPGQDEWLERLQAEAGNLAAAVRWYLAREPGPLPHLFRVL
jgi:hypothetical protein